MKYLLLALALGGNLPGEPIDYQAGRTKLWCEDHIGLGYMNYSTETKIVAAITYCEIADRSLDMIITKIRRTFPALKIEANVVHKDPAQKECLLIAADIVCSVPAS